MPARPTGMQKQQIATLSVAALLALTAACGGKTTMDPGSGVSSGPVRTDLPLTDVRWKVDSVTVDGAKPAVPATGTMEIDRHGRISLGTGCNGYGGDVRVKGDSLTVVGELHRTFAQCSIYLEQYEEAIGDAFKGTLKADVTGGKADDRHLVLTSADRPKTGVTLTTRPAAPLTGTRWEVDALTGPRSSATLPKGGQGTAFLVFGKNGTVSGTLGCNTFHGTAKVSGSTVAFGSLTSTKKACSASRMTVERGVAEVLQGKATYTLSHQALLLQSKDGSGLAAVIQGANGADAPQPSG